MKSLKQLLSAIIITILINNIYAWSDHATITQINLATPHGLKFNDQKIVTVTPLSEFVSKNQFIISKTLNSNESWLIANLKYYKPVPKIIKFNSHNSFCTQDLRLCFLQAIRVNLDVPYGPFVFDHEAKMTVGTQLKSYSEISLPIFEQLKFFKRTQDGKYRKLPYGTKITLAQSIIFGSAEPDMGMDIGLYENNNTDYGLLYGFGVQPLGISEVLWSSQLLFTMSTYHISPIIAYIMPKLNYSYPEYRFHTYAILAQMAHQVGDDYWAGRFAGWAIHYVQLGLQPYHAYLFTGFSTKEIITSVLIKPINSTRYNKIQNELRNNHELTEDIIPEIWNFGKNSLAYQQIYNDLSSKRYDSKIQTCNFNIPYVKNIIDYHTYLHANDFATHMRYNFSESYTQTKNDLYEIDNYQLFKSLSPIKQQDYLNIIGIQLMWLNSYTRSCLNQIF